VRKYYALKNTEKLILHKIDIMEKIIDNLKTRIQERARRKNLTIYYNFYDILGCTKDELRNHLEIKFSNGMTF
jgi:hypothetical protein